MTKIKNCFDDPLDEIRRLRNELLFNENCLKQLIEFKSFIESIFGKIKTNLESYECKLYEQLCHTIDRTFTVPHMSIIFDKKKKKKNNNNKQIIAENKITEEKAKEPEVEKKEEETTHEVPQEVTPEVPKVLHKRRRKFADNTVVCPVVGCGQTISRRSNLKEHIQRSHINPKHICGHNGCELRFKTERHRRVHIVIAHLNPRKDSNNPSADQSDGPELVIDKISEVNEVSDVTDQSKGRKRRKVGQRRRNDPVVSCDWPGCEWSGTKYNFKEHQYNHKDLTFVCEVADCGKIFKRPQYLSDHMCNIHNHRPELVCDWTDCQFKCNRPNDMRIHKNRHKMRRFACDWSDCDFAFQTIEKLEKHVNIVHKKEKPLACPQCEYRTGYKGSLTTHLMTHSSDEALKRFRCDWPECSYATKWNNSLKDHMNSHLNIRPHSCHWPGCDLRFTSVKTLKKHLEIHSNEKNVVCNCGKRFKTRQNLYQHKRFFCKHKS